MASIARKNLLEDIPRFLVAQAGIMFAVSLVTIQTGLQSGFSRSSSLLIDQSQADLWVTSEKMEHLGLTLPLPYERVAQARSVAGVDRAEAVIIRGTLWRQNNTDKITSITLIGAEPNGLLFSPANIKEGSFNNLQKPYTVIADQTSIGAINVQAVGDTGTINSLTAELAGLTTGTKLIVFDNLVFTSLQSANAYINSPPSDETISPLPALRAIANTDLITYVLVRATPGTDLAQLRQRLEATLPNTRAYTRAQMALQTQVFWQERSGIGFILGLGAVVGVLVGIVIVGQILYSSVSDHIKEFGTLKAMGASNWFIYSVIMEQALWMAVLGYIPGIALCAGVASWTAATQGLMILITPASATVIFGTTVLMCISSAVFAINKVTRVDPAIVFKS
jgi:putative ABC transport system permease protein